jgi:hypothetical protein
MLGAFDTDVEENSLYLSQIFDNIQTGKAAVKDELDLPVCNHVKKIMNRFDDEDILWPFIDRIDDDREKQRKGSAVLRLRAEHQNLNAAEIRTINRNDILLMN